MSPSARPLIHDDGSAVQTNWQMGNQNRLIEICQKLEADNPLYTTKVPMDDNEYVRHDRGSVKKNLLG